MTDNYQELNLDGLVGPTHNYSGLSYGNVASTVHRHQVSNPKAAALQGLAKMKRVADLGVPQGVLPPQLRPDLTALRAIGFDGTDEQVIERAHATAPALLAACTSASSMWTANAATVSPSADCRDKRVHFTVANLLNGFHRSLEAAPTCRVLAAIFADSERFCVHPPLPSSLVFADEGAANHTRLGPEPGRPGIELFVYGQDALTPEPSRPSAFPARQTRQSSEAIARRHGLASERVVYAQQHPAAIDAGVFHNDVIAVGHQSFLLYHQRAFADVTRTLDRLRHSYRAECGEDLVTHCVDDHELPLEQAVASYLFNSQLVTARDGPMVMLCPVECRELASAHAAVQRILDADNPVERAEYLDLRQSMNNGGGPACLRLRVVLSPSEIAAMHPGVLLDDRLYARLVDWVEQHYRDRLSPDDLRDPSLLLESRRALDALNGILDLPPGCLIPAD